MKRIALHDGDGLGYPNLALMKLSAWHKSKGDSVDWFMPLMPYDEVCSSKVFSWTPEDPYLPATALKGGTGYKVPELPSEIRFYPAELDYEIEHIRPDYSLYGIRHGLGFLTRGCIRSCPWCVVPKKEGSIRRHADVEEFINPLSRDVVLMDNNVLACEHGIRQIMKIRRLGLRVDFNQGLDARLIDSTLARRLASLRWIRFIRLACDHKSQMPEVAKAVELLRAAGSRKEIFIYVLVKDVDDAHNRVMFLESLNVTPFAQPYRDWKGTEPTQEQKDFARWCNIPALRMSTPFKDYKPRKAA